MEQTEKSADADIETAARLNAKQAARILSVRPPVVDALARGGKLPRYGKRYKYWYRTEDVEALARDPHRLRRSDNSERKNRDRQTPPAEMPPDRVLIGSREAREILGVCEKWLHHLIHSGQLLSYQTRPNATPHRFHKADVEALRCRREAQKKAPRPPEMPSRRPHYITRERLNCTRRIGVGDLPAKDKYFPEWINARQVAWLLNTTLQQAYRLRDTGRIRALKDPALASRNGRWIFCKADVKALMNDPTYYEGRFHYEKYCTPEAIARNKAKREQEAEVEFRQQLDACEAAILRARATQGSFFAANPPDIDW